MSINYNSIKDLVNLLYDFVYEKKRDISQNYSYERLNPEELTLNELLKQDIDYQMILSNAYGEKENFKVITTIFGGLIKKVILKKYFKDFPLTVIVQQHNDKYKDSLSIVDIYYELFVNQLISELVIIDDIPFYLLNICNFNLDYGQIKDNSDFNSLVIKEFEILDQTDLDKKFCFSIYEHYSSYKTLADLLSEELDHDDLYNLFFQVFFAHAYLNYKFGSLRHGSFNIYSFLVSKEEHEHFKLNIGEKKFVLSNVKFICKLFNYRRTEIKGFRNSTVNYSDIENPTYDVYIFFKSLYDFCKKNDKNFEKIKIIISNFISLDIIEIKIMNEDEFYNIYTDTIIPIHILFKNNFFSSSINMSGNSRSIFAKSRDSNNQKEIGGENSLTEVFSGYRNLARKVQSGGKRKSKTGKKKTSKKKGLSRERAIVEEEEVREEVDNIDNLVDEEESEDNELVERLNRKELEEEEEEVERRKINPDRENQNDDLMTEGDDNREKVPLDHDIENGRGKKKIIKSKSKKTKRVLRKQRDDSSTTFDLGDLEGGSESEERQNQGPMSQMPMSTQTQAQMMMPQSISNSQMMARQREGTNKDMTSVFKNLNKGQLIPLLPEMQGMFDINAIAQQQAQGPMDFSTEEPVGSGPTVMDMGLVNSGMGQMGPMSQMGPLGFALGAPTAPSMMGGPMNNLGSASMGGPMGMMGGPMGNPMGNPIGMMGGPMGMPQINGLGAMAGLGGESGASSGFKPLPEVNSSVPSMQGGNKKKKNFFLSKI